MTDLTNIEELFDQCDRLHKGYLTLEDFSTVCPELSAGEIAGLFEQLDLDSDGKIDKSEFTVGFSRAIDNDKGQASPGVNALKRRASVSLSTGSSAFSKGIGNRQKDSVYNFTPSSCSTPKLDILPCQDELISFHEALHQINVPDEVLEKFQKIVSGVYRELTEQKEQNEKLQTVYQREREKYNKHFAVLETELDQQLAQAEQKARKEERERLEREKDEMRRQMETEIVDLQCNIKKLQKMEALLSDSHEHSSKLVEMKQKLSEMNLENRHLKSNLTDQQTNMALIKAELARLQQEYNERCVDLESEKQTLMSYMQEQENLARQLQLLYDANKKLHDTNDNLRSALETRQSFCRKFNLRTPSPVSLASIQQNWQNSRQESVSSVGSSFTGLGNQSGTEQSLIRPNRLDVPGRSFQSFITDPEDDIDSGLVTARDSETTNSLESYSVEEEILRRKILANQNAPLPRLADSLSERSDSDSDDNEWKNRRNLHAPSTPIVGKRPRKIRVSSTSSGHTHSTYKSRSSRPESSQLTPTVNDKKTPISAEMSGNPDRTFRVVLAGDASVGKSSFLMRLCKGQFVANLPSTIGVDYQVKSLVVDDTKVAIQLWDTAGQERFRSMSKSYFRRADGVVLLFDCTCEETFVNVRNWMETVSECSPKPLPLLICANKVDLRMEYASLGKRCVTKEEGSRLARTYGSLFLETSAKDGTNIVQAIMDLSRFEYQCNPHTVALKSNL